MRVEATKTADGLLIPMIEEFRLIDRERIVIEVELVDLDESKDYSALDRLVGLCETKRTDASVNHDKVIYGEAPDDFRRQQARHP